MLWVGYALLSAFSLATVDAISKKNLDAGPGVEREIYLVAWARLLYATPFLAMLLLVIKIPTVDRAFWGTIALLVPLECAALVLYVKALQASPLSLTLPFLSLTPVFQVGTSALMLGEWPSRLGGLGILCVVVGAFMLHAHAWRGGGGQPLRAIWRERGSRFMIGAALIYSITSNMGKQAILHSSPIFFAAVYFIVLSMAFAPIALAVSGWDGLRAIRRPAFVAIGGFEAVMILAHVLAIIQTNVAYMIAVKRTSMIFGLAYGAWWFGERHMVERFAGTLVMLTGVALTVIG
jgi:drug/metabolite transporter (DMT)-like permease